MSTASKQPTTRSRSNARRVAAKGTMKGAAAPTKAAARSLKPRPIPREVRVAAAAMAALGDPVRLELMGMLGMRGDHAAVTLESLSVRFGLDAAIITGHIAALRKLGWAEAVRGPAGWSYRATAAGETAMCRALEFGREA